MKNRGGISPNKLQAYNQWQQEQQYINQQKQLRDLQQEEIFQKLESVHS